MSKTPLHIKWKSMKQRCYDPNFKEFKDYGGRGISVCAEWEDDFLAFYNWAISNGYTKGLILDRKDNDAGYSPDNCRWVNDLISRQHRRLLFSSNSSGFRGVDFNKGMWRSRIANNGTCFHLGYFNTAEEAAIAYNNFVLDNKTSHPLNDY
jgi:hypothetical protein